MCVCARAGVRACMCALAGVGACTSGRVCVVSVPALSPPWNPSLRLACMPCSYSNSGAPGAAASGTLAVEPLAAVEL